MDAYEFAAGFPGLHRLRVDGADFESSYDGLSDAFAYVRARRGPVLVHARCPLLGHHTSGVRREKYRPETDLAFWAYLAAEIGFGASALFSV